VIDELRPARTTDAGTLGEILYRFQQDTEWMPKLFSGAELIASAGAMIDRGWVTVAVVDGRVQGFIARDGEEICALYLAEGINRRGVGRRLLIAAREGCDRLHLRSYAANEWANKFYLRQGFTETGRDDGSGTEDGLAAITFVWTREDDA
jgi:GNAT superfamily N-acetyltransferase